MAMSSDVLLRRNAEAERYRQPAIPAQPIGKAHARLLRVAAEQPPPCAKDWDVLMAGVWFGLRGRSGPIHQGQWLPVWGRSPARAQQQAVVDTVRANDAGYRVLLIRLEGRLQDEEERARHARRAGIEHAQAVRLARVEAERQHGTYATWRHHKDLGEEPCSPCAEVFRAYHRERYARRNGGTPQAAPTPTEPEGGPEQQHPGGELDTGWDFPHGTFRGARRHQHRGDPMCEPCMSAFREYTRRKAREYRDRMRAQPQPEPQPRVPLVGPDHEPGRARPRRQARIVSDPLALWVP